MANSTFTGHRRQRKTPRSVARAERTARLLIYAGGFGTILAIALIFFFLLSVVAPLFGGADIGEDKMIARTANEPIIGTGSDEYRAIAWTLQADGTLRSLQYRNGDPIRTRDLFEGAKPTAFHATPGGRRWIFGFEDGTIRVLTVTFKVEFKDLPDVPEDIRALAVGEQAVFEDGMVERTPKHQFRIVRLVPELGAPVATTKGAILAVDLSIQPSGRALAALSRDGELVVATLDKRTNMLTGVEEEIARKRPLPYDPPEGRGFPAHVALSGSGNELFLVWKDGYCIRYDSRRFGDDGGAIPETERQAEKLPLIPNGAEVSCVAFLNGKSTLLVGDTSGLVHLWFPTRPDNPNSVDGIEMESPRRLEGPRSAVTSMGASERSRLLLVGYENGEVRVFQATRGAELGALATQETRPVQAVAFAPKEDGFLAAGGGALHGWAFDPGYHDVSFSTLFAKVWYERQPGPSYDWQSTGGDDVEPKFGLMPLIFGTMKATAYSMLMAIPIALLAAIYTTEFMRPKARAPVKSVIEMMASLPSVVLGFLAALVVAPYVAGALPATLAALLTVPFAFLLGARLWQLLPAQKALAWGGAPKFTFMALMLPFGILLAVALGPVSESVFYGGDVKGWLSAGPGSGSAVGGWILLLLPLAVLLLALAWGRWGSPWLRTRSFDWDRGKCARFDLARLFVLVLAAFGVAGMIGWVLSGIGIDPRTDFLGQYSPTNALIVGFAMGFAIVPIIYTLAEDALSGVPSQLREGSLGAGATPWQTAVRIIIPTAMSGIFGAIMVGLGRAVGETMIVLMAAGNTPIMDSNPFNGFRALSANIATELPEAAQGSSHYRVLFFSALVLFAMTFAINSGAELVRRRFRARYTEQL